MKVADVTPYYHSRSGGIKRYLIEKSKHAQKRGVEHVLIVPGKERKTYYMNATRVYELPSFPIPFTGGYRFFSSFSEIREVLRLEEPDVVELGGTYQPISYLQSDRYLLSVFYHADVRTDLSLLPGPQKIKSLFLESTIRKLSKADLVIAPSKVQEEFLRSAGLDNVTTVNLGVDPEVFNPSKRNPYFGRLMGIPDEKFRLVYAGRLSPDKNIDLLLEVFQHLDPSLFHLIVVGDGPSRRKVEKLARKLPNLTYLGYLQREEELAEVYASCDIYISTSCRETFGLAFLEAQACGCILVALDMGLETQPFKEFLAKEPTIESFYEAIIDACNHISFHTRERISSYVLERFSWENTFDRLFELYREALKTVA